MSSYSLRNINFHNVLVKRDGTCNIKKYLLEVQKQWMIYNRDMVSCFAGLRTSKQKQWYEEMTNMEQEEEGWITKKLETPTKKRKEVNKQQREFTINMNMAEKATESEEQIVFKNHFAMAADIMYAGIGSEIKEVLLENEKFSVAHSEADIDEMVEILKQELIRL